MSKPQLSVQDFIDAGFTPDETELKSTGNQHVWYYKGNSLEGYVRHCDVILGTSDKFYDYANRRPGGANRIEIDGAMALLLTAMCQIVKEEGKTIFHYPNDFPVVQPNLARGFSTNYNYLQHFGLCGKTARAQYFVTKLGFDWFDGVASCPEYVICNGENVLRTSDEKIFVHELLSDIEDIRNEPLWWRKANAQLA